METGDAIDMNSIISHPRVLESGITQCSGPSNWELIQCMNVYIKRVCDNRNVLITEIIRSYLLYKSKCRFYGTFYEV